MHNRLIIAPPAGFSVHASAQHVDAGDQHNHVHITLISCSLPLSPCKAALKLLHIAVNMVQTKANTVLGTGKSKVNLPVLTTVLEQAPPHTVVGSPAHIVSHVLLVLKALVEFAPKQALEFCTAAYVNPLALALCWHQASVILASVAR